ncbi:alpha/beta fold hydrolase [Thioalkalivibrio sp. ALJ24]|uniref:alpha/beta fold hydrolase n=1 Tax=Thioalkalivibrio sp. ALJ24 TaxID=545276 RepID=UPI00036A0E3D|nr:alpha/beta hydrolase [Thioalkalivibrio sp. ALJ24]
MTAMRTTVVTLHGWHMTGVEMALLRRRLRAAGYRVRAFRYPSRRAAPEEVARALAAWLETLPDDMVHLVGHSLGGVILRHLFTVAPVQRPGRVVMLGSPLQGSRVAARLASGRAGRWWLGRALDRGLLGGSPVLRGRQVGMIAGTRGRFPGPLLAELPEPHDGLVAVEETRGPEVSRHLQAPVNHMGLILSDPVARAVAHFLEHGEFGPETTLD